MTHNTVPHVPFPTPAEVDAWTADELHERAYELRRYAPAASLGSPVATLEDPENLAILGVVDILRALNPLQVRTFLERCEYAYHDTDRKDTPRCLTGSS